MRNKTFSEKRKYYEAYELRYRQVHGRNISWASDSPTPIVLEMIRKYIGESARILDIGCGEGRDSLFLLNQGYDVTGIDVSEEAIRFCRGKADPKMRDRFLVLDVCQDELDCRYHFIYSIATIHMLVLQKDRDSYLQFIRNHLLSGGYALILTMGDGITEMESDISEAFQNKKRTKQETGEEMEIAATSCKMVSFDTFRAELQKNGFEILEDGLTSIEPDFPTIMYALVQRKLNN